MKILFNCSTIKNVYFHTENNSQFELKITYTDNPNVVWESRKSVDDDRDREMYKSMYEGAFNSIKQALLENDKFVEIEI